MRKYITMLFFSVSMTFASAAVSRTICGDYTKLSDRLYSDYKEEVRGAGISVDGSLFQIYVGPANSWSILVTKPGKSTCLVVSGENWIFINDAPSEGEIGDEM